MKVYRTGGYADLIEVIEVTRINEKSIWVYNERRKKEERSARFSHQSHWETLEEAKQHLRDIYNRKIEYAEKSIIRAKKDLEKLDQFTISEQDNEQYIREIKNH